MRGIIGKSKITGAREHLRCPVCFLPFGGGGEDSLVCASGHCFDIARKGYVNLIPNQRKTKYSRKLFEYRRIIFDDGLYNELAEALIRLCDKYARGSGGLLDAGCGEGYFSRRLKEGYDGTVFALDIEREAVRLGASAGDMLCWMVADIKNIPLADGSVSMLFNLFTPSSYAEFRRVLVDGGVIVKVIPGSRYLEQVRALLPQRPDAYDNTRVIEHFSKHFQLLEHHRLTNTHTLTPTQSQAVLRMTPLLFDIDEKQQESWHLDNVTIDVELLVGKA